MLKLAAPRASKGPGVRGLVRSTLDKRLLTLAGEEVRNATARAAIEDAVNAIEPRQ